MGWELRRDMILGCPGLSRMIREAGAPERGSTEYLVDEFGPKESVRLNGLALAFVRMDQRTPELCTTAVYLRGPPAMEHVPADCVIAVLNSLPKSFHDANESVLITAMGVNGMALEAVKRVNPNIIAAAVTQNPCAIAQVKKELQSEGLCMLAVQGGSVLKYVHPSKRTPVVCFVAAERDGKEMAHVPENRVIGVLEMLKVRGTLTLEACLHAMRTLGMALGFIPEGFRTISVCMAAVRQNGRVLMDQVPRDRVIGVLELLKVMGSLTPEICLYAVKKDGMAMGLIPEDLRTTVVCMAAVQQEGMALQYVPEESRTDVMYEAAERHNVRIARRGAKRKHSHD